MKRRSPKKHLARHPAPQEEVDLTFSAKDFPHHPKNHFWFVGMGILALAALIFLYQTGEYQLMLVVAALMLVIFRLARLESPHRQVRLTPRGVYWGDEFYPYFKLRAFWIATANGTNSVYIERLNFSPTLHLIVPESRLEELVLFLADYLPIHPHRNEPLADKFNRLLRL